MKIMLAVFSVLCWSSAQADVLVAEYEGTIVSTSESQRSVGDHIEGREFFDTALAGPDLDPASNAGNWGYDYKHEFGPDFIWGFRDSGPTGPLSSTDEMFVTNSPEKDGLDSFLLNDDPIHGRADFLRLNVRLNGLLDDADNVQSFAVTQADVNEKGESLFGEVSDEFEADAKFLISRLTVRPARCVAH